MGDVLNAEDLSPSFAPIGQVGLTKPSLSSLCSFDNLLSATSNIIFFDISVDWFELCAKNYSSSHAGHCVQLSRLASKGPLLLRHHLRGNALARNFGE